MTATDHGPRRPGLRHVAGRLLAAVVVALGLLAMHGVAHSGAGGAHEGMPVMTALQLVPVVAQAPGGRHARDLAVGCLAVLGGLGLTVLLRLARRAAGEPPAAAQLPAPRPLPRSIGPPRPWPSVSLCVIRV